MARKKGYDVGFGKPPSKSRFKRGRSGNPKGRPKGSKNLGTVFEKELSDRVTVTENGRERRFSKGEVAVKQLVNKAAAGDSKALQTILNYTRAREDTEPTKNFLDVFNTPEHHLVMVDICRRIRAMDVLPPAETGPPSAPPKPKRKRNR